MNYFSLKISLFEGFEQHISLNINNLFLKSETTEIIYIRYVSEMSPLFHNHNCLVQYLKLLLICALFVGSVRQSYQYLATGRALRISDWCSQQYVYITQYIRIFLKHFFGTSASLWLQGSGVFGLLRFWLLGFWSFRPRLWGFWALGLSTLRVQGLWAWELQELSAFRLLDI